MSELVLKTQWSTVITDKEGVPCGLEFSPKMPFKVWQEQCEMVLGIYQFANRSAVVLWGDLLNYGSNEYGEMYAQAVDESGFALTTLRNAKCWTAKLPPSRRDMRLTPSHWQTVASCPPEDQERWQQDAYDNRWTVKELRRAIKGEQVSSAVHVDSPYDVFFEGFQGSGTFESIRDEITNELRAFYDAGREY